MKALLSFALLSFYCVASVAQPSISVPRNPLLSGGVDWLNPGYGVRAQSLGNAMIARKGDVSSLWWNPAGLQQDSVWRLEITGFGAYRSLLDVEKNELGNSHTTLSPSYVGLQIPTKFEHVPVVLAISYQNQRDFTNRNRGQFVLGSQLQTVGDPISIDNNEWSVIGRRFDATNSRYDSPISQKAFTVGAAIQASSWIRLGAALRVHIFNESMSAERDRFSVMYADGLRRFDGNASVFAPLPTGSNLAGQSNPLFFQRQTTRLSYYENISVALQPNFGGQFEFSKRFSLPFDFVFGIQFSPQREVERTFSYQLESSGQLEERVISGFDGSNFGVFTSRQQTYTANPISEFPSNSTLTYALPAQLGLGILLRHNRISLSIDAVHSSPHDLALYEETTPGVAELIYSDIYFDASGNEIPPTDSDRIGYSSPETSDLEYPDWSINEFRFGLEYLAGEKKDIAFRLGYHQLPELINGPFANPSFSNAFLMDMMFPPISKISPRRTFSFGTGFSLGSVDIDLAYSLLYSQQGRRNWAQSQFDLPGISLPSPSELDPFFRPHSSEYFPYDWKSFNHRFSVGFRYNFKVERKLPDYYQLD